MRPNVRTIAAVAFGVATGLVLAPTTAQAVVNYFNTTKVVTAYGTVACPAGYRVTGGGYSTLPVNTTYDEYFVTGSFPYVNGWRATATRVHYSYNGTTKQWSSQAYVYKPKVSAVCAT